MDSITLILAAISLTVDGLMIQISKYCICSYVKYNVQIRLQFCTCHNSLAVVTCANLWPELIKRMIIKAKGFVPIMNSYGHLWNTTLDELDWIGCRRNMEEKTNVMDRCGCGLYSIPEIMKWLNATKPYFVWLLELWHLYKHSLEYNKQTYWTFYDRISAGKRITKFVT